MQKFSVLNTHQTPGPQIVNAESNDIPVDVNQVESMVKAWNDQVDSERAKESPDTMRKRSHYWKMESSELWNLGNARGLDFKSRGLTRDEMITLLVDNDQELGIDPEVETPPNTQSDYESMTVLELKSEASDRDIELAPAMLKKDIINVLQEDDKKQEVTA